MKTKIINEKKLQSESRKSEMKTKNLFLIILCLILFVSLSKAQIWEQTNGPYGGNVASLAIHPNGDLYAGVWGGGLLRSTNNGNSWSCIGFTGSDVGGIFISSNGYIFLTESVPYRSTDYGITWQEVAYGPIAKDNAGNIYSSRRSGNVIYKSTNSGTSWIEWTYYYYSDPNDFLFKDPQNVFLSDHLNGIYRLVNNIWVKSFPSMPGGLGTWCIEVTNGGVLLAGTGYYGPSSSPKGVYRSVDNGVNWERVFSNGIENTQVFSIVTNSAGIIFAGTTNGVFKSADEGVTWDPIGMQDQYVNSIVSIGTSTLIGTNSSGFHRWKSSGTTWENINVGLFVNKTLSVAIDQTTQNYFAVTSVGIFRSTNRGDLWQSVLARNFEANFGESIKKVPFVVDLNSDIIYTVQSPPNRLYHSSDDGTTWDYWTLPSQFYCLESGSGTGVFWGGGDVGIFYSNDYGLNWNQILSAPHLVKYINLESTTGYIFAGSDGSGIYRSTDLGTNWRSFNIGLLNSSVESVAINSIGDIFAGTHNGIFRSKDLGGNWKYVGLDQDTVITMVINSLDHILVGTMSGYVYISRDNGNSWNDYSSGLNTTQVRCIVLDENDFALVGTASSGVYRSIYSTVDIRESDNSIVTSFDLFQNYPNPFNPSTIISYQLPKAGNVTLKVFDVLGREVTTLVDEYRNAGSYDVEFRIENLELSSGVYFYQLKAGDFVQTKKMILIR